MSNILDFIIGIAIGSLIFLLIFLFLKNITVILTIFFLKWILGKLFNYMLNKEALPPPLR